MSGTRGRTGHASPLHLHIIPQRPGRQPEAGHRQQADQADGHERVAQAFGSAVLPTLGLGGVTFLSDYMLTQRDEQGALVDVWVRVVGDAAE